MVMRLRSTESIVLSYTSPPVYFNNPGRNSGGWYYINHNLGVYPDLVTVNYCNSNCQPMDAEDNTLTGGWGGWSMTNNSTNQAGVYMRWVPQGSGWIYFKVYKIAGAHK